MNSDELLDRWPPSGDGEDEYRDAPHRPEPTLRPDPLSMLFDGIPEPVIVTEDEELPLQRAPSGQLAFYVWLSLITVLALIHFALRVL